MIRKIAYLLILSSALLWGAEKVAVATKVSGQVSLTNVQNQTLPLRKGTVLNDGEKIESGSDGLAVILFLDDKSIIRVQKNTILSISGEVTGVGGSRAIGKRISIENGKMRAQITEQRGEFQIITPTSVASVKGTDFWITVDPVIGDIFLGVDGLIEVENLISGDVIEVGGGQVGSSLTDGTTEVTTYVLLTGELMDVSEDLLTLEAADAGGITFNGQVFLDAQTTYAGPDPEVGMTVVISGTANDDGSVTAIQVEVEEISTADGGAEGGNELRIQLEDADGNIKEVIIIYE